MKKIFNEYSTYLKEKYGTKVYKLPINLPLTCPNRDGNISYGGCTFCSDKGTGFESLSDRISVKNQIIKNMEFIKKKYKAEKFIAYFQNYTNTYIEYESFVSYIKEAILDNIVEISISTRPDCINEKYLEFLKQIEKENNINISIELGLQTVNYKTLIRINRGHTLAEFINAVNIIKKYDYEICTHIILNLPGDTFIDVIETAKVVSALKIDQVKLHSLYIAKSSKMAEQFEKGEIKIISKNEYIERVILFLEHLEPNIVIQRLLGRAPEEETIFANWNTSWWKIKDEIIEKMVKDNRYQGKKIDYLKGKDKI